MLYLLISGAVSPVYLRFILSLPPSGFLCRQEGSVPSQDPRLLPDSMIRLSKGIRPSHFHCCLSCVFFG